MRVALVSSGFAPEVGGVEAYVQELARSLIDLGCNVDVLTQCPRGSGEGVAADSANQQH